MSYKIVGVLFDVFNSLGYNYQEKYYQRAIAKSLKDLKINFKEQVHFPVTFKNEKIGSYFADFIIEDKIILEIKRGDRFSRSDIDQTMGYLKRSNLKLGILGRFSSRGLKFKRILNLY